MTTLPDTHHMTAQQQVVRWNNLCGELADRMPRPAPAVVTVKVHRIVRSGDGFSQWRLIDKGELARPALTANKRPSRFAPEWAKRGALEVLAGIFEFDSPAFLACPDKTVWEKAVEWANSPDVALSGNDALTLSRAILMVLTLRCGGGKLSATELP